MTKTTNSAPHDLKSEQEILDAVELIRDSGDHAGALKALKTYLPFWQKSTRLSMKHARLLIETSQTDKAAELLDKLIAKQPTMLALFHMRIEVCKIQNDLEKLLQCVHAGLQYHAQDLHLYNSGIWAALSLEKIDEVHALVLAMVEHHPQNPDSYCALFDFYTAQGELTEATEAIHAAKALSQNSFAVVFRLGKLNYLNGNFEKAIELYQTSMGLENALPLHVYMGIADCFTVLMQFDTAQQVYASAIELYPVSDLFLSAARASLMQGDFSTAFQTLKETVTRFPNNDQALLLLTQAMQALNLEREAIAILKIIKETNPRNTKALVFLSDLTHKKMDIDDFIQSKFSLEASEVPETIKDGIRALVCYESEELIPDYLSKKEAKNLDITKTNDKSLEAQHFIINHQKPPTTGSFQSCFINGLICTGRTYLISLLRESFFDDRTFALLGHAACLGFPENSFLSGHYHKPPYNFQGMDTTSQFFHSVYDTNQRIKNAHLFRHPLDALVSLWVWFNNPENSFRVIKAFGHMVYSSKNPVEKTLDENFDNFTHFAKNGSFRIHSFQVLLDQMVAFHSDPNHLNLFFEGFHEDLPAEYTKLLDHVEFDGDRSRLVSGAFNAPRSAPYRYRNLMQISPRFAEFVTKLPQQQKEMIAELGYDLK